MDGCFLRNLPPPAPGKPHSLSVSVKLVILGTSYKWNHTVLVLLWLACFTEHNVLKVRPRCCNRKWGPASRHSKANKEARLVERKVCFILQAGSRGGGQGRRTSVQRPTPTTDNQGARAFTDSFYSTGRNSTGSSNSHHELGHRWSDQRHLDCFRYS